MPREHLEDLLGHLCRFSRLPAEVIDGEGRTLLTVNAPDPCCRQLGSPERCAAEHRKAGRRADGLGEAYIFICHAGLGHIAYPLRAGNRLLGTVLLGPFLMEEPAADEYEGREDARALLEGLTVIEPARVTSLSRLMNYIFQSILPAERAILMQEQRRLAAQARISEAIHMYKNQEAEPGPSYSFFYEKEQELLVNVKTGDIDRSRALLNELLGYALFSEGWNVRAVRLRAIELTTLLSRVALEGGAGAESVFRLNEQFLSLISGQNDVEEISLSLLEVVEGFMDAAFYRRDKGNLTVRKALRFVAAHYAEPLRVGDAAAHVGLSPDYFAKLFRATVGESFNAYLARVRVEQSRRLLLSTSDSLTDIAVAMGFSDQSYYCRMFRRIVGVTPGQYRR